MFILYVEVKEQAFSVPHVRQHSYYLPVYYPELSCGKLSRTSENTLFSLQITLLLLPEKLNFCPTVYILQNEA